MQPLHLRVALTLLLICCPSFSVASIVVGVRTNDEIFIGADSKMVRDEPRKVWTECKTGFNGNVAWGYIGTISSEEDNFSLAQDVQFYMSTNGTFLDRARALESTLQIKLSNIASRWKKRSPTFYAERYEG